MGYRAFSGIFGWRKEQNIFGHGAMTSTCKGGQEHSGKAYTIPGLMPRVLGRLTGGENIEDSSLQRPKRYPWWTSGMVAKKAFSP